MAVRFVMGPTPRTCERSSQQLTRDSNLSATRKDASGALRKVMYHKSCYLNKRRSRCNGKHHLTLCKSAEIDGHKFSGKDPAEENTSNASTGNPKKDDLTIPEESILVGLTHNSQDTILLQSAIVDN